MTNPLISQDDPYGPEASEFGGVPGYIQPPPHQPTPAERLAMIYAVTPDRPPLEGELPEV